MRTTTAPPRGTRPRNRREPFREAAASLFAERGYARVSLSEVAAAVNVGPSSLYRHYSSKSELLYHVVDSSLDLTVVNLPDLDNADVPQDRCRLGGQRPGQPAGRPPVATRGAQPLAP